MTFFLKWYAYFFHLHTKSKLWLCTYTFSEQLYAHYLSRASFYGGLICLLQTSPESPGIFRLMHRINMAQSVEELREACVTKDITEVDFKSFLVYCSGIYANMVCSYFRHNINSLFRAHRPNQFTAVSKQVEYVMEFFANY